MKNLLFPAMAFAVVLVSCEAGSPEHAAPTSNADAAASALSDGNYVITKVTPEVTWAAEKLTGEGHSGKLHVDAGKFKVTGGAINEGFVSFDMTQISVTDLTGESKENLEGHLKSGDFFNVEVHPTANLKVNGVTMSDASNGTLACTLSMNGVDADYEIPVQVTESEVPGGAGVNGISIVGKFALDRTKHGIKYQSGTFFDNLDWAIKDDVMVGFRIMGTPMNTSSVQVPQNF